MSIRHRKLGLDTVAKFQEFFVLANECNDLADIVVDNLIKQEIHSSNISLYRIIILANYFKASNAFLSVIVLCDKGLTGDAKTICRKIVELNINMIYLSADNEKRQYQYWNFSHVKLQRELEQRLKSEDKVEDWIRKRFEEIKSECDVIVENAKESWNNDNKEKIDLKFNRYWSGKTLPEMAKDCNMKFLYVYPYVEFCRATHAGPDDLWNYFDAENVAFVRHFEQSDISLVLFEAVRSFLCLSELVIREFGVDLLRSHEYLVNKLLQLKSRMDSE